MRYVCLLCGYVYDDDKESVPFADLPDDWSCPMCGAPKSMFEAEEQPEEEEAPAEPEEMGEPIRLASDSEGDLMAGLSAGQLAALCGNLARGCEKQGRLQESELFSQLAKDIATQVKPIDGASVQALADLLLDDERRYAQARKAAEAAGDRGSLRVITWGERITKTLSYLLGLYLSSGEAFLKDSEVWVCTVCGFIYVGNEPPELCPVCKVPAWKFQKMERSAS